MFTVSELPDGQAVTSEEMERALLAELEEDRSPQAQTLWNLAILYSRTDRHDRAIECMNRVSTMADGSEEEASCYLAMGQLREQIGDYENAARYYRGAFGLKPRDTDLWYWINNNLGYCLIRLCQFKEAEGYLKSAVAIDPRRSNAFKNLGLALAARKEYAKAAEYLVRATQVNAADPRSLTHLEQLVVAHPDLMVEVPDLQEKLDACREAVEHAASVQPDFDAHWKKLRERQEKQ